MRQIEPGITATDPPKTPYCAEGGEVITYHLPSLTAEQIERYGLQRYVAAGKAVSNDVRPQS